MPAIIEEPRSNSFAKIKTYVSKMSGIIYKFIKSSFISLIILILIGVILPIAPQVNSIVVNLYYSPINFLVLLLFASIYAVVLSHYPNYFFLGDDKNGRKWKMAKFKILLFGIIWYRKAGNINNENKKIENYINFLRRTLGVFFYSSLFYLIAYTSQVNFDWSIKAWVLSIIFLVIMLVWLYYLNKSKNSWKNNNRKYLSDEVDDELEEDHYFNVTNTEYPPTLLNIKKPIKFYLWSLFISLIVHLVFIIYLIKLKDSFPYKHITVLLSLACIVTQGITYLYYRTYRSVLKYVFFNENYKAILLAFDKSEFDKVKLFFKKFDDREKNIRFPILSYLGFGAFSNNITFLQIISAVGVINAAFLIYINIYPLQTIHINAIIIILSYFFFFYGIIIILIKHGIYYRYSKENYAKKYKNNYAAFICLASVIVAILYIKSVDNDLYTLKELERNSTKELTLKNYIDGLPQNNDPQYYIGCYGGGMKSNAWTMIVLNELYKRDSTFFQKTIGISGASGGTMGLINMSTLIKNKKDSLKHKIEDISTTKMLSIDFTHALGRDLFIGLFFPCKTSINDRSKNAMRKYAELTGFPMENFYETSYRDYWCSIYKQEKPFPILIANTTNITGKHGVAISVNIKNTTAYNTFYNGADNILEIPKNKTLSYYAATSTSNRFPLLSPSARIEKLGHYNDGGIFENSGMLSVYSLYNAVNYIKKQKNDTTRNKTVFINIVNDKNLYIKHILNLKEHSNIIKTNGTSELSAILQSIVATEMMPNYIKSKIQTLTETNDGIEFESIYLPHTFNEKDVKSIYGEIDCKGHIQQKIDSNNLKIRKILSQNSQFYQNTKAIVEPPMSRVMANPAYEFMEIMLKHSVVNDNMNTILNY